MTDPQKTIESLGLTVKSEFVPFSRSRNKDETRRTLNWRVTLERNGRAILTTDYSAGIAHCPSYSQGLPEYKQAWKGSRFTVAEAIQHETEIGKSARTGKTILPDSTNVIWSLVMDSNVLEYTGFTDWAESFGYDSDSIKARKIYETCLSIALNVRNAFTSDEWEQLCNAFQDY